jgi:hypothetical protein
MCQRNYYYYYYYHHVLTLFSRLLMLTFNLYRLSHFAFCSFNNFCIFLCTRANFVIGRRAVKFASK